MADMLQRLSVATLQTESSETIRFHVACVISLLSRLRRCRALIWGLGGALGGVVAVLLVAALLAAAVRLRRRRGGFGGGSVQATVTLLLPPALGWFCPLPMAATCCAPLLPPAGTGLAAWLWMRRCFSA